MNPLAHPKHVYAALAVAIVGLFALSAVGNTNDAHKATHGVEYWVGAVGWFGFLLALLLTILYSVALLFRTARQRHRPAASAGSSE
jgi:hypothetical protein